MSTIIYEPRPYLNLYHLIGGPFVNAGLKAASDFIAGDNKPWEYYLGVAFGNMAGATGIPNAAASLYAIGNTLDMLLFKSPDGSSVEIFLNGVLVTTFDAYDEAPTWQSVVIALAVGVVNRVDIVNRVNPNPAKSSLLNWMGISTLSVTGDNPSISGASSMAYNSLVFRLKDIEANTTEASVPVYLPQLAVLSDYQDYADAFAPELDAATGSQIVGVSLTVNLDVAAGLKANPLAGHLNERGGLITFDTTGPRADSFRIPGIRYTIMPGDEFSIADAAIAAIITRLTTATVAGLRPRTTQDYQFSAARAGKKSFRK